jgi:hypothetical protein
MMGASLYLHIYPLPPQCSSDPSFRYSIIIETDSTAIASRVSRPQTASGPDMMLNEQAVAAAVGTVKEGLRRAFAQF